MSSNFMEISNSSEMKQVDGAKASSLISLKDSVNEKRSPKIRVSFYWPAVREGRIRLRGKDLLLAANSCGCGTRHGGATGLAVQKKILHMTCRKSGRALTGTWGPQHRCGPAHPVLSFMFPFQPVGSLHGFFSRLLLSARLRNSHDRILGNVWSSFLNHRAAG